MLVFGGCKNYLGNHKQCDDNVILYPGTSGRSAGSHRCQTDDNAVFAQQFHLGFELFFAELRGVQSVHKSAG